MASLTTTAYQYDTSALGTTPTEATGYHIMGITASTQTGIGGASSPSSAAPNYFESQVAANDYWKGFDALNAQTEGTNPIDAAVAASSSYLLNAIAGKAAIYALNSKGNSAGVPSATTTLRGLFGDVQAGLTAAAVADGAGAFGDYWGWPSAVYDKIAGRFVLACASSVQGVGDVGDGAGVVSPVGQGAWVGGVYLAASDGSDPVGGAWKTWGVQLQACEEGEYSLPDMVQVGGQAGCCISGSRDQGLEGGVDSMWHALCWGVVHGCGVRGGPTEWWLVRQPV